MKKTLLCLSMLIASSSAMASAYNTAGFAGFDHQLYNFPDHKFALSFDETKMQSGAEIQSYNWELTKVTGNANMSDVAIRNENKADTTFTFNGVVDEPVVLTFKLTVTQDNGTTTSDEANYYLYKAPEQVKFGNGKKAYTFGKYYKVGDIVTYKKKKFQCVRGLSAGPASGGGLGLPSQFVMGEPCTFGAYLSNGDLNSWQPDGVSSSSYSVWRPIGVTKAYKVKPYEFQDLSDIRAGLITPYRLGDRVTYEGKTYQCGGHHWGSGSAPYCSLEIHHPNSYYANKFKSWVDVEVLGDNRISK